MTGRTDHIDVLIVGGGPAGISAALWCDELGLQAILLEKNSVFGGQLLSTFNRIENYLGLYAEDGRAVRDIFTAHIESRGIVKRLSAEVTKINAADRSVVLHDGSRIAASTLIISTGVRRRRLQVPGESEFEGRGILVSGKRDALLAAGKRVVIVGGGDAAMENALILGEHAAKTYVVHRRPEFSARPELIAAAKKVPGIEFLMNTSVTAFRGGDRLESVELHDSVNGEILTIDAEAALIRIGVEPNSELVRGEVHVDTRGYIMVDRDGLTNIPGVFAAGDIANPVSPTINTAAGMGATAAKAAFAWLSDRRSC